MTKVNIQNENVNIHNEKEKVNIQNENVSVNKLNKKLKKETDYYSKEYTKDEVFEIIYKTTAPLNKNIKKLCLKYNIIIKQGQFSKDEMKIISNTICSYIKSNNVTIEEFKHALLPSEIERKRVKTNVEIKDLMMEVCKKLTNRTLKQVFWTIYHNYSIFKGNDHFTLDQDKSLLNLIEQKGKKWTQLQLDMEKRKQTLVNRYMSLMDYNKKTVSMEFLRKVHSLGLPKTENDYKQLSEASQVEISVLKRKIKQYLKGRVFEDMKDILFTVECALVFLVYNFYACIPLNVKEIMEKIKNTVCYTESEIDAFIDNFLNIMQYKTELSVKIEVEDLYWTNIGAYFEIAAKKSKSKFYELKKEFNWIYFNDIYETAIKNIKKFLSEKMLEQAVEKHTNSFDK